MSGKNHHYIPQFLLKGFSSRKRKREIYCWVFRKSNDPIETNIRNINSQNYFYGRPSENEAYADEILTRLEGKFAKVIDDLRLSDLNINIDSKVIGDFVGHLMIRSNYLRNQIRSGSSLIFHRIIEFLEDEANLVPVICRIIESNPDYFYKEFEKELKKIPVLAFLSKERLYELLKEKKEDFANHIAPEFKVLLSGFKLLLNRKGTEILRVSHNKALAQSPIPTGYSKHFAQFDWYLDEAEQTNFILGDTAVVFKVNQNRNYVGFPDLKEIQAVFLPISSSRIVIGCKKGGKLNWDEHEVNTAIAMCSDDCFISQNNTIREYELSKIIGKNSYLTSREDLIAISNVEIEDWGKTL